MRRSDAAIIEDTDPEVWTTHLVRRASRAALWYAKETRIEWWLGGHSW